MGITQFEAADEEFNLEQMEAETEEMLRLRYIDQYCCALEASTPDVKATSTGAQIGRAHV